LTWDDDEDGWIYECETNAVIGCLGNSWVF
jgi:hypothetical protein